jgi:CheY-like chemotaxis protein
LADPVAFLTGRRCLVLDDEYLIALDIQQILEAAGAAGVTSVSTAAEALEVLGKESNYDLAVLDIKLGGATDSSMTVAALLSEQGTPFVFLTGMRADEIAAGPFAGVPVVEKPYQAPLLIETVRRVLAGK